MIYYTICFLIGAIFGLVVSIFADEPKSAAQAEERDAAEPQEPKSEPKEPSVEFRAINLSDLFRHQEEPPMRSALTSADQAAEDRVTAELRRMVDRLPPKIADILATDPLAPLPVCSIADECQSTDRVIGTVKSAVGAHLLNLSTQMVSEIEALHETLRHDCSQHGIEFANAIHSANQAAKGVGVLGNALVFAPFIHGHDETASIRANWQVVIRANDPEDGGVSLIDLLRRLHGGN